MVNAQHTTVKVEHYTPLAIVKASRELMGGIDLDPASDIFGNTVVQADKIYTRDDDSLNQPWEGKVFLNPPGGKVGNRSLQVLFWDKLYEEWLRQKVSQAIFLGFSLEILAKRGSDILKLPFCIPQPSKHQCISGSGRIKFIAWDDESQEMKAQNSPTHGNVIVYLHPRPYHDDCVYSPDEVYNLKRNFRALFAKFGEIVIPQ
jgi:hypothetical protein